MPINLPEFIINILSIIGILGMGYFIGRIIEAWLIGSWNYPKEKK